MATREKIREGIASSLASIDGYEWETLADNLKSIYLLNAGTVAYNLHSQGVVIKETKETKAMGSEIVVKYASYEPLIET